MTQLFLDANVLFTAAHNPHGKASLVLEPAAQGHWQALTSTYAAAEARRNVALTFPDFSEYLEQILVGIETVGSGRAAVCPLPLRDKDKPVFEAALLAGATHLHSLRT